MAYIRKIVAIMIVTACALPACNAQAPETDLYDFDVKTLSLGDGDKSFIAEDINGDQRPDLIVTEEAHNRIAVFLNDTRGGFERPAYHVAGDNPTAMASLDFNQDGHIDIAVGNHEAPTVSFLKGDGAGGFEPAHFSPVGIIAEPHAHMIRVADFNNDGHTDLIIDSRDRFGVFILSGQSDGLFDGPGQGVNVGGTPYLGFALGDINDDGAMDIVTPNTDHVSVLLNRADGALSFEQVSAIPSETPFATALADINGDGQIDVIVGSGSQRKMNGVKVLLGDGQGHFGDPVSYPIAGGAKTIATGDVNGDGVSDVLVTSWNADIGLLTGGEQRAWQRLPAGEIETPWSAVFADFDGDGRDEILVGDASSGLANIYSIRVQ